MKPMLFALTFLLSQAHAAGFPSATYIHTKTNKAGVSTVADLRMDVVNIEGDMVTVKMSEGEMVDIPATMKIGTGTSDYMTAELGAITVANCEADGGTLETITVAAGEFETCKITTVIEEGTSTSWFAAVPFGWVKSETDWKPSGNFNVFELKELRQ